MRNACDTAPLKPGRPETGIKYLNEGACGETGKSLS